MLRLHIVQAEQGDCLILEYGTTSNPRHILIDGGPSSIYDKHLRDRLREITAAGGKLDLVVLSHVDDDHIVGLLDLAAELKRQRSSNASETAAIAGLWHNTFSQTLGRDVEDRFRSAMRGLGAFRGLMNLADQAERDIGQGDELTQAANTLHIPINGQFAPSRFICVDDAPQPITFDNLSLHIIGPGKKNLEKLGKEWIKWLQAQESRPVPRDPIQAERAARETDQSIPNLSSIMFLARANDKTILFTGDGRGDHLLQGLQQAGLAGPDGKLHVNVLKLPHHGSQRNIKPSFFQAITADQYVVSANGLHGNPDLATLRWIVEAARTAARKIEIMATNATDSTQQLLTVCPPEKYGYRLTTMGAGAHVMTLELAS